jgi:hypothetical protein
MVTVRELVEDYLDDAESGAIGYGGNLDIRPPYQREFIYNGKQREAVLETVQANYPLNTMYWAVREDGTFELIDGQQRTIAICQYVDGGFMVDGRYFHNLTEAEQEQILDYELMVYTCTGTDREKLEWFKIINIAGEKLTDQELRNAAYAGAWVTDAKRHFSKSECAAYQIGSKYLSGTPIRQDYLETVIKWISAGDIDGYMAKQQHKPNANDLWLYFQSVIAWVTATFPVYRSQMKGLPWGALYGEHGSRELDPAALEVEVSRLMADEDVTAKKGIYAYVLGGPEKLLSIRSFSPNQKREAYERQQGICPVCHAHFEQEQMEADHITPWHEGGKTASDNCQMLCKDDNRRKGGV